METMKFHSPNGLIFQANIFLHFYGPIEEFGIHEKLS